MSSPPIKKNTSTALWIGRALCLLALIAGLSLFWTFHHSRQTPPPPKKHSKTSLTHFKREIAHLAYQKGANKKIIERYLMPAKTNRRLKKVKRSLHNQPIINFSFTSYRRKMEQHMSRHLLQKTYIKYKPILDKLEEKYQVPGPYIIAIWAAESNFGRNTGRLKLIDSLLTLAYFHPRRSQFFKKQLIDALVILSQVPHIEKKHLRSTFDGGMGLPQFEPSSYLSYAVAYDPFAPTMKAMAHHHYSDIWSKPEDALASIANYLSQNGWDKDNDDWGFEIKPTHSPGFESIIHNKKYMPLSKWKTMGIIKKIPSQFKNTTLARLVMPDGENGPAFLVSKNFETLLSWNPRDKEALIINLTRDRIVN